MPPKLDLGLALKVVKPFDGTVTQLSGYIESIELLKDYAEGVPEADLLKFMKTTLNGVAHGSIDEAGSIAGAFAILKEKFSVKLTPVAVESEMLSKKQANRNITDFGNEIEQLATKLAAAHVSQGTFATAAAASKIVESVAVRAFVEGLQNPTTQFLMRARNPTTLNKAISDALECNPVTSKSKETALWFNFNTQQYQHNFDNRNYRRNFNSMRGRGYGNRGFSRGRGNFQGRGRDNHPNRSHYNNHANNQRYNENSSNRGRNSNRGRIPNAQANLAAQNNQEPSNNNQPNEEEVVNHFDLFRE